MKKNNKNKRNSSKGFIKFWQRIKFEGNSKH